MNQPDHNPRLRRAVEAAIADVHEFARQTLAAGHSPNFKVVSFNGDMGYFEHTDWEAEPENILAALEASKGLLGFGPNSLEHAMNLATDDLSGKNVSRSHRIVYLYTDGYEDGEPTPVGTRGFSIHKEKSGWSAEDMGETAIWRMTMYERENENHYANPTNANRLLFRHLKSLSGKTWSFLNMEGDPSPIREKMILDDFFMYFSTGKDTEKVYVSKSSTGTSGWYSDELGNNSQSSQPPSPVHLDGYTYVFYKGVDSETIYYRWSKGTNGSWEDETVLRSGSIVLTTGVSPAPIVLNGKIRVYYVSSDSGIVRYVESTGISSNGSLSWASTSPISGVEGISNRAPLCGVYDPLTDKTFLLIKDKESEESTLFKRAASASKWDEERVFNGLSRATMVAANNDIYMAYKGNDQRVYFARRSAYGTTGPWDPVYIDPCQTSQRPGIACVGNKVVIAFKGKSTENIYYTYSTNQGATWAAYAHGTEHTRMGIGAVGFTHQPPLSCYFTGPYTGTPGQLLTWNAYASGGCSPYTYRWYVDGLYAGSGSSFSYFCSLGISTIRLEVTDSCGSVCISERTVTISNDNCIGLRLAICDDDL